MRNRKHVAAHEDRQVLRNGWTETGTECEQRRFVREQLPVADALFNMKDDWRRVVMFEMYTSVFVHAGGKNEL